MFLDTAPTTSLAKRIVQLTECRPEVPLNRAEASWRGLSRTAQQRNTGRENRAAGHRGVAHQMPIGQSSASREPCRNLARPNGVARAVRNFPVSGTTSYLAGYFLAQSSS